MISESACKNFSDTNTLHSSNPVNIDLGSTILSHTNPTQCAARPTTTSKRPRYGNTNRRLSATFKPTENTVICGRSKEFFDSKGNDQLRNIVRMSLDSYMKATGKLEKSAIVSSIVQRIRSLSPEGAFVKYENGLWYEVGDAYAREKVGAQFRDYLPTSYRSSAKSKYERKKRDKKPAVLSLEQSDHAELSNRMSNDSMITSMCVGGVSDGQQQDMQAMMIMQGAVPQQESKLRMNDDANLLNSNTSNRRNSTALLDMMSTGCNHPIGTTSLMSPMILDTQQPNAMQEEPVEQELNLWMGDDANLLNYNRSNCSKSTTGITTNLYDVVRTGYNQSEATSSLMLAMIATKQEVQPMVMQEEPSERALDLWMDDDANLLNNKRSNCSRSTPGITSNFYDVLTTAYHQLAPTTSSMLPIMSTKQEVQPMIMQATAPAEQELNLWMGHDANLLNNKRLNCSNPTSRVSTNFYDVVSTGYNQLAPTTSVMFQMMNTRQEVQPMVMQEARTEQESNICMGDGSNIVKNKRSSCSNSRTGTTANLNAVMSTGCNQPLETTSLTLPTMDTQISNVQEKNTFSFFDVDDQDEVSFLPHKWE